MYSSKNKFKENISKAKKVKVEVDDIKLKEDIKKLDDGLDKSDLEDKQFDDAGKLKPNIKYKTGEYFNVDFRILGGFQSY